MFFLTQLHGCKTISPVERSILRKQFSNTKHFRRTNSQSQNHLTMCNSQPEYVLVWGADWEPVLYEAQSILLSHDSSRFKWEMVFASQIGISFVSFKKVQSFVPRIELRMQSFGMSQQLDRQCRVMSRRRSSRNYDGFTSYCFWRNFIPLTTTMACKFRCIIFMELNRGG